MTSFNLRGSLRATRRIFRNLAAPKTLAGRWRIEFAGPLWLRRLAPLGLNLSALRGWHGKSFDGDDCGVNLMRRGRKLRNLLPMRAVLRPSRLDGGLVMAASYGSDAPVLQLLVTEEFRILDNDTLLGMMILDLPGLRRQFALPFLLHRSPSSETV
ncbi:MAG: hypothetical protein ACRETW_10055 [Stenotrophobium sp.]